MGYTHYLKAVDSPSSLQQALETRKEIGKVLERNKKVIQYEDNLPYAPENAVIFDEKDNPQNMIRFNGIGEEGHETFYISSGFEDGFNFCKTARKAYDTAVCECLLLFKHFLNADVSSNGFSNCQPEVSPYKVGSVVRSKDIDGTWALAVKRINKQLGTKYRFVCTNVRGDKGQYFSYELNQE